MRISYGLRAFGLYFIILGSLVWFTLDNAVERLNDSMRQSAESVMVDVANLLAESIEQSQSSQNKLATEQLAKLFNGLRQRELNARIYSVTKTEVDSSILVTDEKGIVVFDSTGTHTGEDFSRWNDIKLTLQGAYGARTSFVDQDRTEPDDPKAMYIAAPIYDSTGSGQKTLIGAVSVAKPIATLETHLVAESKQLQNYAFLLLLLALAIGYLLSLWFTYALRKISEYANAMAAGKKADQPVFLDSRLAALSNAVTNLRTQIDGKDYVENYIHSLTHELKTPLTSIGATVELMQEPMSEADQLKFLTNLQNSNQRMARLVDRMLSLAQLEGLTELVNSEMFDLMPSLQRLVAERDALAQQKQVDIKLPSAEAFYCRGDTVLLSQSVGNLLDNALRFCDVGSQIMISLINDEKYYQVVIRNQGEKVPDYALSKLFDRFFSLPSGQDNAEKTKSTGLGLSFVKEIMKLHKGDVSIRNFNNGVIAQLRWPCR